jgi:hypothetical protein
MRSSLGIETLLGFVRAGIISGREDPDKELNLPLPLLMVRDIMIDRSYLP